MDPQDNPGQKNNTDEVLFESARPKVKKWYQKWWGIFIIIILGLILSFLVAFGFYVFSLVRQIQSGDLPSSPAGLTGSRLDMTTIVRDADPATGPRDAKVLVVEFSDFQCPFCGQSYPVVKELLKDFGNEIRFVYKDFPLADIHPQAVLAALAGQCAHEQGLFWEMHDIMFENQDALTDVDLRRYAIQAGLNSIQFGSCMQNNKYLQEVQDDFNEGVLAGVASTPTFFINGLKVEGSAPISTLRGLINAELNR